MSKFWKIDLFNIIGILFFPLIIAFTLYLVHDYDRKTQPVVTEIVSENPLIYKVTIKGDNWHKLDTTCFVYKDTMECDK